MSYELRYQFSTVEVRPFVIERFERACVVVLCHDFDMEQRTAIKFCFKLGKSASEMYELLQKAYGSDSLSLSTTFEWFKRF
jgi:hypothetical protein